MVAGVHVGGKNMDNSARLVCIAYVENFNEGRGKPLPRVTRSTETLARQKEEKK